MALNTPSGAGTARVVLRRMVRNLSLVLGGRVMAALMSLVAITWMARILTPAEFGVVVLIHAGALVVRGVMNFKPSDAVVRFGVALLDQARFDALGRLLRFTLMLDVVTAVGAAVAGAVIVLTARSLSWLDSSVLPATLLYVVAMLVTGSGSAKGLLRLFDRFDLIGVQYVLGSLVRLAAVALAWWQEAGMEFLIAGGAASLAIEYGYVNIRGWLELRRRVPGVALGGRLSRVPRDFPGLGRFVAVVYFQTSLDLLSKHGYTLLAGAVLGPAGAGLFRLAREFSDVLAKPVVAIRQAVFPDLTRLWRGSPSTFRQVCVRVGLGAGGLGAVVVLAVALTGEALLGALVGRSYVAAAPVLTLLMAAGALELGAAALRPAAYAMGRAEGVLRIQIAMTLLHTIVFLLLTQLWGLSGAGWAAIGATLLSLVALLFLVMRPHGLVASARPVDEGLEH